MKRKFVFLTLVFFSFAILFAVPGPDFTKKGHKNFHGKRMMEDDKDFHLLFVKATELPTEYPGVYNFGFVFSQPVNPDSVNNESFSISGKELNIKKIRFSKNYRIAEFLVKAEDGILSEENLELTIKEVESISGKKIEPVVIKNFHVGEDYKLMRKVER